MEKRRIFLKYNFLSNVMLNPVRPGEVRVTPGGPGEHVREGLLQVNLLEALLSALQTAGVTV